MKTRLFPLLFAIFAVIFPAASASASAYKVLVMSPSGFFPGSALSTNLESLLLNDPGIPPGSTVTYRDISRNGPANNQWVSGLLGAYHHPDYRQSHVDAIRTGGFTHVVLIDRPFFSAVAPELHMEAINAWARVIRGAGAEPMVLMPWVNTSSMVTQVHDYYWQGVTQTTFTVGHAAIREHTFRVAAGTSLGVIPAGTTWQSLSAGEKGTFAASTGSGFLQGGVDVNLNGSYAAAATAYTHLTGGNAKSISFVPAGMNSGTRDSIADKAAAAVAAESNTTFPTPFVSRWMRMIDTPGNMLLSSPGGSSTEGSVNNVFNKIAAADGRTSSVNSGSETTSNLIHGRMGRDLSWTTSAAFYPGGVVPEPPTKIISFYDRAPDATDALELLRNVEWQSILLVMRALPLGHTITPKHLFMGKIWHDLRIPVSQTAHASDWVFYAAGSSLYARMTNGSYGMHPALVDYVSGWAEPVTTLRYGPSAAAMAWETTVRMATLSQPPPLPERSYGVNRIIDAELAHELSGGTIQDNPEVGGQPNTRSPEFTSNGQWARYLIDFESPGVLAAAVSVNVASTAPGGSIEVREGEPDGPLLATLAVPSTGALTTFTTLQGLLPAGGISGEHSVVLVVRNAGGTPTIRIDYFRVSVLARSNEACWSTAAGGSWGIAANWVPGIPDGSGQTARFSNDIPGGLGAPTVVTLDGERTVGQLALGHGSGSGSVEIHPGSDGSLRLENGSDGVTIHKDTGGTDRILAPVLLGSTLTIRNSSGVPVELGGSVTSTSATPRDVYVNGPAIFSGSPVAFGRIGVAQSVGSIDSDIVWTAQGTVVNFFLKNYNSFTMNGGTLTNSGWTEIGDDQASFNGACNFTLNAGQFEHTNPTQTLRLSRRQQNLAVTLNLNGGVFATAAPFVHGSTTATTINLNGGALRYTNNLTDAAILIPASVSTRVGAGGAVFDVVHPARSATIPGALTPAGSSDGGLVKVGAGELVLGGNNTFSGPVQVSAGKLRAGSATALGTARHFLIDAGATLDVTALTGSTLAVQEASSLIEGAGTLVGNLHVNSASLTIPQRTTPLSVTGSAAITSATITVSPSAAATPGLSVSGPIAMGGNFDIQVVAPSDPIPAGTAIPLLTGSSRIGTFANVTVSEQWEPSYTDKAMILTARQNIAGIRVETPNAGEPITWGSTTTLTAEVRSVTAIESVEFFVNGVKVGDGTPGGNDTFALEWTAQQFPAGSAPFFVRVTDADGAVQDSPVQAIQIVAASGPAATWVNPVGGTWSIAQNWSSGVPGDLAQVGFHALDLPDAVATVTLDSPRTVSSLQFGDSDPATAGSWRIAGTSLLTLSGGAPVIDVAAMGANATAQIAVPLAGTTGFTKTGNGTLVLSGSAAALDGSIRVNSGTVLFSGQPSIPSIPIELSGGQLTFSAASGNLTVSAPIALGANTTVDVFRPTTFSGSVDGNGPHTLRLETRTGGGILHQGEIAIVAGSLRTASLGGTTIELRNMVNVDTLEVQTVGTGVGYLQLGNGASVQAATRIVGRDGSRFFTLRLTAGAQLTTPLQNCATNDQIELNGGTYSVGQITLGSNTRVRGNGGDLRATGHQTAWISGNSSNNALWVQAGGLRLNTNLYEYRNRSGPSRHPAQRRGGGCAFGAYRHACLVI
jgi:autotransporter-associated beta strand protein